MIRLVASDVDGTLLPDGTMEINPELFQVIRKLKENGIVFMAASGRSMASLQSLFEPVKDEIYFAAENGAYIMYRGQEIDSVELERSIAENFVIRVRDIPNTSIIASKKEKIYIEGMNEDLYRHMIYGYHNIVEGVDDVLSLSGDFLKISLYKANRIQEIAQPIIEQFQEIANPMIAGPSWLDLVGNGADKGHAIRKMHSLLGISRYETMAFGDNCNDLGMLAEAEESYAVENARSEVKVKAKNICGSNVNNGVLEVLKTLLC